MPLTLINIFILTIVFILFYNLKSSEAKIKVLLIGSLVFYIYHEPYLSLVMFSITLLSFYFGKHLEKNIKKKRKFLFIFFILIFLIYYPLKYNETFEYIIKEAFSFDGLSWLYIPLGLSFYTFKTMTYILDIYFERSKSQDSFQKYLLFISFFPQIFCGPIMGPDEFFKQLNFESQFNLKQVVDGLRLMVLGLFKKIVLANNLILIIQLAYKKPLMASGIEWVLISILTRFYIYYDFSGYSDISNGASLLFGIKVQKNFDLPFKAKSITEFWRRWHISLSSWIRDYVYFPLVSLFSSNVGIYLSLVLSFVFLGLWHGDHLNYILYGLLNGVFVATNTYMIKINRGKAEAKGLKLIAHRISLYLFLIFLPTILLMSKNFSSVLLVIDSFSDLKNWFSFDYFLNLNIFPMIYFSIPLFLFIEIVMMKFGEKLKEQFNNANIKLKLALILLIVFITFVLMPPEISYRFLYQGF